MEHCKNNKKLLLIVDGENLLHRAYHKFLGFKSSEGIPTGAVYGFLKILHSNIFRFKPDHVVVTFDNGRSKYRLEILPEYKSGRKKLGMDYESLQAQKGVIRKMLRRLCVPYIFDSPFDNHYEADDYIGMMVDWFEGEIIILSSDKDFHQFISKKVKVMSPSKDILITTKNCKSLVGYEPEQCVDYLSLVGDTSDAIPGYKGVGEKTALALLEKYSGIGEFLISNDEISRIDKKELNKVWSRGIMLIDINHFIRIHPLTSTDVPVVYGKEEIDELKLKRLFNKYSLSSFQSNIFIDPFKELTKWKLTRRK